MRQVHCLGCILQITCASPTSYLSSRSITNRNPRPLDLVKLQAQLAMNHCLVRPTDLEGMKRLHDKTVRGKSSLIRSLILKQTPYLLLVAGCPQL